ncbi:MAG: hypothetical protein R8P61_31675 [Bacteroidia bacterium]|nr:hypothetical protein [Bacteroidia bacterium]
MDSSISYSKSLAIELSQSKDLLLFPTRNYERITLQQDYTKEGFWEIRNSRGKRVKFGIVEANRQDISIESLENGVYFLSLYKLEGDDVNRTSFIKFAQ